MVLWSHFQTLPVLWLVVTLAVFLVASWFNVRMGKTPFLHPVLVSLAIIILVLLATNTDYDTYMLGGQYIHLLLGPAVVALAIPLYDNLATVKRLLVPLLVGCVSGAIVASVSAIMLGMWFGLSDQLLLTLAPKSVTSPIAIAIAEKVGGFPSLAAGLVLITGAMGCVIAPVVYKLLKIEDESVKGFVLGVGAHAMGTAFAFEYGMVAGAFGGLAMGMTGAFTAFFLPVLIPIIGL
ncbi:LrgB family protein [Neptuniibacter sp. 1_MG-2023]|uniref:LrgB family protein n=1 Tax=Neptuniibacter sp. 1_MG-2023 TaxID=3062662 RepID=UPI0026E13E99|nr:LrgB family protein [Neptuniibacter sp. 1_MG-2023]MDO6592949.1 LrgB family protein [Neptuniibacter sp. 1_MG-2023]